MKNAVRYYSRSGNTKLLAEAIANTLHVQALSVDNPSAEIHEKTEVLFIGGALYAYGLDKHLKEYIQNLNPAYIGKAVVFSTSWISKHSLDLIKKALKEKGIAVAEETLYAKNKPDAAKLSEAHRFAEKEGA